MVCQLAVRIFFPPFHAWLSLAFEDDSAKATDSPRVGVAEKMKAEGTGHISLSFLDLVGRICLFCSHFDLCFWLFGDQLILSDSSWPLPQNFRKICPATISGRKDCSDSLEMITFVGLQLQGRQGEKPAAAFRWLLWRPGEGKELNIWG